MNAIAPIQTQKANGSRDISDTYFLMLKGLSPDKKLLLAERLIESVRVPAPKPSLASLFGAWESDKSAEEMIEEIEGSRTSTTDREPL